MAHNPFKTRVFQDHLSAITSLPISLRRSRVSIGSLHLLGLVAANPKVYVETLAQITGLEITEVRVPLYHFKNQGYIKNITPRKKHARYSITEEGEHYLRVVFGLYKMRADAKGITLET